MEIRELSPSDAQAWWDLRLESLETDPSAFSKSSDEHRRTPVAAIASRFRDAPASTLNLGAFENGKLLGMAAFMRENNAKERHKGRIYAVYVSPSRRGKGIARQILAALILKAAAQPGLEQILISVATTQAAARHLYRSLGFEPYSIEPRALKLDSTYIDEEHLILRLPPAQP